MRGYCWWWGLSRAKPKIGSATPHKKLAGSIRTGGASWHVSYPNYDWIKRFTFFFYPCLSFYQLCLTSPAFLPCSHSHLDPLLCLSLNLRVSHFICLLLCLSLKFIVSNTYLPSTLPVFLVACLSLYLLLCLSLKLRVSHSIFYSACLFSCVSLTLRLLLCRPLKLRVSQYICPLLYNLQYLLYLLTLWGRQKKLSNFYQFLIDLQGLQIRWNFCEIFCFKDRAFYLVFDFF